MQTDLAAERPSDQASWTSLSLLRRARDLDQDAWRELVATYAERINRWCRRAGLPPPDAADVTQEVFAAIAANIDRFRREKHSDGFRKWIGTITTRKVRDFWRMRRSLAQGVGGSTWQALVAELEDQLSGASSSVSLRGEGYDPRATALAQVRRESSARDWAILERLLLDEHCAAEVADEFEVKINVVYLVKSRLLRRIREQLGALTP